MATEDLTSLFGQDPRMLQQAMDLQMAQLDPAARAYMQGAFAGRSLGQAAGNLFGVDVQDPMIKQATQLRALASEYDTTTPEGLMEFGKAASKINPKIGFQAQQQALGLLKEQSIISKNLRERAAADPFQKLVEAGKYTPESLAKYRESGDVADLKISEKTTTTSELGKLLQERAQLDPVKDKDSYDAYNAKIKKLTTGGGIGSEIAAGLSPIMGTIAKGQAQKAGEAGGTAVGKESAAIQGKYTALSSIKDALDVVERGIYAGGYGPMEEALAKYGAGVVGNKNRLVNTEEFRAYIGDVVIPRLQEFGGNDSVEELKYLRSVMAGETTLEQKSITRILQNADKKIRSGIQRLEAQQKAIGKGEQLPVGPVGGKQFTTKSGVVYTKE
jgi:hypothetical protein